MKTSITKKSFFLRHGEIYTLISFILIIAAWKITSLFISSEIILPSPENTALSMFNLIRTREFFIIILSSLQRGLLGFVISFILGALFGFLSGLNKIFKKIFEPFLSIIRTTPVITIILIALIWFKANNVPVFASFLMAFPIICTNIIEGIENVDKKILEMANIFKIKKSRVIGEIYIPSLIPFLTAAVSSSFGIGWKVVIAAEVLSQPKYAIGTSLQTSKIYLNINDVFAWTIYAILIGYIIERIIRFAESKTVRWKK